MSTKIPKPDYYYMTDYSFPPNKVRSLVNLQALSRDIQRGVSTLSEHSYCASYGVTQTSIAFALAVRQALGQQNYQARRAEMTYSQQHHYTLRIETFSGYTIVFKGVSGGYYGEGSRGAHDILKAFGFDARQCGKVFERANFELRKIKQD